MNSTNLVRTQESEITQLTAEIEQLQTEPEPNLATSNSLYILRTRIEILEKQIAFNRNQSI